MIGIILIALYLYIAESNPTLAFKALFSSENTNRIETIFRMLLLPALLVGELVIDKITRTNIFQYGKKLTKPFRLTRSLVAKQLFFFRQKSVKKLAHTEHDQIVALANDALAITEKSYSYNKMLDIMSEIE